TAVRHRTRIENGSRPGQSRHRPPSGDTLAARVSVRGYRHARMPPLRDRKENPGRSCALPARRGAGIARRGDVDEGDELAAAAELPEGDQRGEGEQQRGDDGDGGALESRAVGAEVVRRGDDGEG